MVEDVADALRGSVVKLFTVYKEANFYKPWELLYQKTSGGSACILPDRRILTNAHGRWRARAALQQRTGNFHVIETDSHGPRWESQRVDYHGAFGTRIVLDANKMDRANAEILEQHGIANDRSADLR